MGRLFANGKNIVLGRIKYSADTDSLRRDYAASVAQGYFPKGTDYRSIIVHEMGHAIDFFVGEKKGVDRISHAMQFEYLTQETGLKSAYGKAADAYILTNVSKYAKKNQKELFAECFSEYVTSVRPRDMAKWYGERIEKKIREVMGI